MVYNGKCFVAVMNPLSWYDARDNCIERGGRLAEVCEPELNDILLQISLDLEMQQMGRFNNVYIKLYIVIS